MRSRPWRAQAAGSRSTASRGESAAWGAGGVGTACTRVPGKAAYWAKPPGALPPNAVSEVQRRGRRVRQKVQLVQGRSGSMATWVLRVRVGEVTERPRAAMVPVTSWPGGES